MKTQMTITVDEENLRVVREFCEKTRQPVTHLFDAYVSGLALTIKAQGLHKKERLSKLDFLKLAIQGCKTEI